MKITVGIAQQHSQEAIEFALRSKLLGCEFDFVPVTGKFCVLHEIKGGADVSMLGTDSDGKLVDIATQTRFTDATRIIHQACREAHR